MFPEYRDLITQLKTSDHHFGRLFDAHNSLDQKIQNMESHIEVGSPEKIEQLKKDSYQKDLNIYKEGILSATDLLTSLNEWKPEL